MMHGAALQESGNHQRPWRLHVALVPILTLGILVSILSVVLAAEPDPARRTREIELVVQTAEADPLGYEVGSMVAKNWRDLGFDVKLAPTDWARVAEIIWKNQVYDTAAIKFAGRANRIDPDHWIYTVFRTGAVANETVYSNPEYDRLADLQRTTLDLNKRREIVFKAQELVAKDQPFTPIVHPHEVHAYNADRLSDVEPMMVEGLNGIWIFIEMKPKAGPKILRWGYPLDVATMNPTAAIAAHDFEVQRLIYDSLVHINRKGYPEKWAADEIKEISPTVIEVKIRSGMKFHDGKPLTAEDVRFTFDLFRTEKATRMYPFASVIKEIQVLDGLRVRFTMKEPYAPFLVNSLSQVPLLPKHIWEGLPQKAGLSKIQDWPNTPPIGSGPFKLDYWRRGEEMKLTRNDAHFRKPYIEGIVKIPYADVPGAVAGLERGENDMVSWNVGPVQAKRLAQLRNIKVVTVRTNLVLGMDYNNSREPFKDPRVRRALAYAIPKSTIVQVLYEGRADIGQSVIAPVNEFWHSPNVEKFDLDMAKARKLLQEAGFEWDSSGKIYSPRR